MNDLTKGSPLGIIIKMSIPIMLGNLFQQLYSTVDAIIVGKYIGDGALAAVGATQGVYSLIIWFVCGVAGGCVVVLAQDFGAGQTKRFREGVCQNIEISAAITLVTTIFSLVFLRSFMSLMKIPQEIFEDTMTYLIVIIAGMAATMLYNMCASILRAMGDSKTPFYFIIISSVINIVLDILFIRFFGMGVLGAALATIISQAVSGIMCAVHMYLHFEIIHFGKEDWKYNPERIRLMLSYGLPSGLCGITTALGIMILQVAINVYGTTIIAGYTAAIKLQNFVEVPFNAMCITMVNYSGQNLGAGKIDRLHSGYISCMIMAVILAVGFGIVAIAFGRPMSSVFVDKASATASEVVEFSAMYIRYAGYCFIPFCILLITRSTVQGMGFRSAPVIIGVIESVFRIIGTIYLINVHNVKMICMVSPIIWVVTSVILIFMYIFWIKHLRKILKGDQ